MKLYLNGQPVERSQWPWFYRALDRIDRWTPRPLVRLWEIVAHDWRRPRT